MEHMTTTLNLSEKETSEIFGSIVKARNGVRDAIRAKNGADAGYYFGWLDSELTKLANAVPSDVSNNGRTIATKLGGGGAKPN